MANGQWRFRLAARTHASHAWNTGSIPVGATKKGVLRNSFFMFYATLFYINQRIDRNTQLFGHSPYSSLQGKASQLPLLLLRSSFVA